MFIREIIKQNKGYKKKFIYNALMESYRTEKGPRQRMVLSLGKLNLPRDKWKELANRIEEIVNNQQNLYPADEEIETLAQHYATVLLYEMGHDKNIFIKSDSCYNRDDK